MRLNNSEESNPLVQSIGRLEINDIKLHDSSLQIKMMNEINLPRENTSEDRLPTENRLETEIQDSEFRGTTLRERFNAIPMILGSTQTLAYTKSSMKPLRPANSELLSQALISPSESNNIKLYSPTIFTNIKYNIQIRRDFQKACPLANRPSIRQQ